MTHLNQLSAFISVQRRSSFKLPKGESEDYPVSGNAANATYSQTIYRAHPGITTNTRGRPGHTRSNSGANGCSRLQHWRRDNRFGGGEGTA
jgi:hypothetical protein